MSIENMTPVEKVAVLMVLLAPDASARLLQSMEEEQIKAVSAAMCSLGEIPREVREKVLDEFYETVHKAEDTFFAGPDSVKLILQNAVGREKATGLVNAIFRSSAFDFLKTAPMKSLAGLLESEHPQTAAVVLGQLSNEQAAELLSLLPEKMRGEVLKRTGAISEVSLEAMEQIGKVLEAGIGAAQGGDDEGPERVADIISLSSKAEADAMLEDLRRADAAFAEQVVKKLVTFEKLAGLPDAAVQKVLRKLDQRTLATCLKGAPQDVSEKIYKNMTEEASKAMMEDIETMGQVSEKAVEEARRKVVRAMKSLAETGELQAA